MWGIAVWLLKQIGLMLNTFQSNIIAGVIDVQSSPIDVVTATQIPPDADPGKIFLIKQELDISNN